MRPLNTRERRVQFFRFLAFFLLAVAPFVVLVWLYGRVDKTENEFLRGQYSGKVASDEATGDYLQKLNALMNEAEGLRTYVASKSGVMQKLKCEESGNLTEHIDKLKGALDVFGRRVDLSNKTDSSLVQIADHLRATTEHLNAVYEKACDQATTRQNEYDAQTKKLTEAEATIARYVIQIQSLGGTPR